MTSFSKYALFAALLAPGLLSTAYGQRGGGHSGGGYANGSARSGGFSGGSGTRGGSTGGGARSFRGGNAGSFRGGYYGGRGSYYGGRYFAGPSLYLGFGGYPYYYSTYPYGHYGYDPYYYGYDRYAYDGGSAPPPQKNYGYPPQGQGSAGPARDQQPAPQYGPPQTQPQSSDGGNREPNYYLVAFNDHTIQAATAYKVEGDQFYWIDRDNREQHAPLSSVDVPFSQQINRDRQVDFQIP